MCFQRFIHKFALIRYFALFACITSMVPNAEALSPVPPSSWYEIKGGQVFFVARNGKGFQPLATGVDASSFQCLRYFNENTGLCDGSSYVRDRQRVYFEGRAITNADPNTFELINMWFAKDRSGVYALGRRLIASAASFRALGDSQSMPYAAYATDGQRYFYKSTTLAGEGFEFVPKTYEVVRTSTSVYYRERPLEVDVKSFEGLEASVGMTRDKRHVYYRFEAIPKADPETIEQIYGYLWRDKRAVYLEGKEIVGLDPATVRRYPPFYKYTSDYRSVLKMYEKIDRDLATFTVLQPPYTKDKNGVYYNDERMEVADPGSFVAPASQNGQDKNYRFYENKITCKINANAPATDKLCDDVSR